MDRNDPTATVQAVADLLGHLDGAFWASLRCTDYPARTLVPVWQAIEDCETFIKQQLGIPLPTEVYGVFVADDGDQPDAG